MSGGPVKKDGMTGGAGTEKKPVALSKGGRDEGRWGEALAAEYLRQRGYRLGIIANQEPGLPARLDARGLGEFLSVILSSAEFGSAKPEPGIFEAALRQANCRPEEAAMVGDRLDNDIAPARKLGMRTVRILQGYGALAQPRNAEETPDAQVHTLAELLALFPPVMSQED